MAGGDARPVPSTGHHAFDLPVMVDAMAVDRQPQGHVPGAGTLDVEKQLGALDLGRGDIEFDTGPVVPAQLIAELATDPLLIGQHQGGSQPGAGAGPGIDENGRGGSRENHSGRFECWP